AWSRSRSPDGARRNYLAVVTREAVADLGKQFVAHHVVAEIDGVGEALGMGATVAFDHDPVEAEKNPAIRLAWIHLVAKRAECAARQKVTEPPRQRAVHLVLEVLAELARGALGGLKRDIAGKALGHHHIHGSLADIVTFDEAGIFELRPLPRPPPAQPFARPPPPLKAFPPPHPQYGGPPPPAGRARKTPPPWHCPWRRARQDARHRPRSRRPDRARRTRP